MSELKLLSGPKPTQYEKITVLYRSGRVKRLHCIPTLREHNVAQHVYGSLLLGIHFCEALALSADRQAAVMRMLVYHDNAELVTGDIPAPVKRADEAVKRAIMLMEERFDSRFGLFETLSLKEQKIVKASDALDLAFNCLHEREMGNQTRHLAGVFENAIQYALETELPGVEYFTQALQKDWDYV